MADETKSPELVAIETVAKQVVDFKNDLTKYATKEELKKFNDSAEKINKDFETLKTNLGNWDGESVESMMKKINTQLKEMQEDVQRSKDSKPGKNKFQLFDPAEVKAFVKDVWDENGAKTSKASSFKINNGFLMGGLVSKAAEIMGYPDFFEGVPGVTTDVTAFTGRVIDPTLYQRKRKRNFILDNFTIPSIAAPTLIYLEKMEVSGDSASNDDPGGAEWIVPGAQKPMRSFRVTSTKVEAKKVAIFGTVHDDLLRDVPSLENWIREDFTAEMRESYNDALLNNDPATDPDAPLGLKENAIQYADTAAFNNTIFEANEIDAIIAAIAYMASLKEEPMMAAVSSSVYYKLFVLKDLEGRYQNNNLVYTNSRGQIFVAGVPVIMADQDDIADTHLLLLGVDGFQIRNYESLVFERGLNGEDFRYDRTSYRAYQKVLSYIPSHRYNSVLYDTFTNIITAIDAP
jgi:HK97 family phage major capsid protein